MTGSVPRQSRVCCEVLANVITLLSLAWFDEAEMSMVHSGMRVMALLRKINATGMDVQGTRQKPNLQVVHCNFHSDIQKVSWMKLLGGTEKCSIVKAKRPTSLPGTIQLRQTFQASDEVRLKRLISTAFEMRLKFCRSTAGIC